MNTFVRVTIIIWTLAFVGGLITGKSVFSLEKASSVLYNIN